MHVFKIIFLLSELHDQCSSKNSLSVMLTANVPYKRYSKQP